MKRLLLSVTPSHTFTTYAQRTRATTHEWNPPAVCATNSVQGLSLILIPGFADDADSPYQRKVGTLMTLIIGISVNQQRSISVNADIQINSDKP